MNRITLSALPITALLQACSFDLSTDGLFTGVAAGDVVPDQSPVSETTTDPGSNAVSTAVSTLPTGYRG